MMTGWLNQYAIHRRGRSQAGWSQAEPLLFCRGVHRLALKAFQMMKMGPPRLSRILSLTVSQLLMGLNNIGKMSSQQV